MFKMFQFEIKSFYGDVICFLVMNGSQIIFKDNLKGCKLGFKGISLNKGKIEIIFFFYFKCKIVYGWDYSKKFIGIYFNGFEEVVKFGVIFQGKYVLMIGVGVGFIGVEVFQGFISGGVKVIVIISCFFCEVIEYYQFMYICFGFCGL